VLPGGSKTRKGGPGKIRDKKKKEKKCEYEKSSLRLRVAQAKMSVSMSRKPERAVHAKMRLKRKAIDYI